MALVSITFFALGFNTRGVNINPYRQDFVYKTLSYYAQTALDIKVKQGEAAFITFLTQLEEHISLHSYVFDQQGQAIYGTTPLPSVAQPLTNQANTEGMEIRAGNGTVFISLRRTATNNESYNFIWEVKFGPPPLPLFSSRLGYQVIRIIAIILAAGLLCYWLSRYFTTPIVQLTQATQELANGNLNIRIGNPLATRKDELADLAKNFNLMAARISQLLEAQKQLIRDISHELRSPLARLNVALLLARKRAGSQANEALDRIELESERLNELIGQLLMLARMESGKEITQIEPIPLEQLIQELAADADFEAQSMGKSVKIVDTEPCEIDADETLLRRAIENVLRNAIRYTLRETTVEVSLHTQTLSDKTYAIISVSDHGEGVPTERLSQLFLPFYRVSDSRERGSGGTGLGLAIVEQAVKLHHGKVNATNIPNAGLKIEIQLPLKQ